MQEYCSTVSRLLAFGHTNKYMIHYLLTSHSTNQGDCEIGLLFFHCDYVKLIISSKVGIFQALWTYDLSECLLVQCLFV